MQGGTTNPPTAPRSQRGQGPRQSVLMPLPDLPRCRTVPDRHVPRLHGAARHAALRCPALRRGRVRRARPDGRAVAAATDRWYVLGHRRSSSACLRDPPGAEIAAVPGTRRSAARSITGGVIYGVASAPSRRWSSRLALSPPALSRACARIPGALLNPSRRVHRRGRVPRAASSGCILMLGLAAEPRHRLPGPPLRAGDAHSGRRGGRVRCCCSSSPSASRAAT